MNRIERLIYQNVQGGYAVYLSRYAGRKGPTGNPKTTTSYHGGLSTLEQARAKRAELEAANPPRRPGRKAKPQHSARCN